MSIDEGLVACVAEAVEPLGTFTTRAMMGGATLYLEDAPFAIIALDQLWFKADAESDAAWDAAGAERFTFAFKNGRVVSMNYRRAPEDVHDDADTMREWATLALEAGRRAAAKRKPRIRKPKA